ncbi:MAG: hypothetical protein JNG83_03855 [Opitutaceae bacterium]|nr:hypothetical protein [Opitutaceae bacterium]
MNIQTIAVTVCAPRADVFNFLADIENLPRWAGGYCERIALVRGRWWALTAEGDQVVELEADGRDGVIDLRAGPHPARLNLMPMRVVGLSERRTLVTLTVIEAADQTAAACARRYRILREAARGLLARFGGGELHGPAAGLFAVVGGRN